MLLLPAHGHQMRCEADSDLLSSCISQPLFDLRHVSVLGDTVTVDAFSDFTVQVRLLRTATSTTDTCDRKQEKEPASAGRSASSRHLTAAQNTSEMPVIDTCVHRIYHYENSCW